MADNSKPTPVVKPAKESRPNTAENDSAKDSEREYDTLHLDSNPPTSENDPDYVVREGRETAERNHKAEQARLNDDK